MADSLRAPAHRVEPRPSALAALTVNGANRFRRYSFAPTHATWGLPHRTTRIRVKAIRDEAPPLANCIGGGASKSPSVEDGLRGGGEGWPETPPGTTGPGGQDRLLEGGVDGPTRLDEAMEALVPDAVLHAALGPALVNSVVAVKRYEIN